MDISINFKVSLKKGALVITENKITSYLIENNRNQKNLTQTILENLPVCYKIPGDFAGK